MIAALMGNLRGDRAAFVEILAAGNDSAPNAAMAAFFSGEFPRGTTITAAMPWRAAASAIDWP